MINLTSNNLRLRLSCLFGISCKCKCIFASHVKWGAKLIPLISTIAKQGFLGLKPSAFTYTMHLAVVQQSIRVYYIVPAPAICQYRATFSHLACCLLQQSCDTSPATVQPTKHSTIATSCIHHVIQS